MRVNDWEKEGEIAGKWLIEYLEEQGKLDEEIEIAEIRGIDGAEAERGRDQGFRERIKNNINLKIVVSESSDYTYSYAYEDMTNILSETTDIDVLYCHNDDMAFGAIEAIEEAGLVPEYDISKEEYGEKILIYNSTNNKQSLLYRRNHSQGEWLQRRVMAMM